MKHACFVSLLLCFTTTFVLSQSNPVPLINQSTSVVPPISTPQSDPKAQAKVLDQYGKLPLSFEANHGQADARVKFLSRTSGYTLFLTGDEAVLTLSGKKTDTKAKIMGAAHTLSSNLAAAKHGSVLRMKLRNANPAAKVTGMDELAGTSNYFIGNDPAKWRTNVPTYAKVKYEGIYSGIDLVYYGNQRQLEYDFIVAPGADPHRIHFDVRGAERIHRNAQGDLILKMSEGEIRWHKPVVYQEKDGTRQLVAADYAITNMNRVRFEVAKYDASKPLYIDPLIYSTYLGGSGLDGGTGIAVDNAGNAYITGFTASTDFPTMKAFQSANGGGDADIFVSKLNPSGSALVYSTYLGGGNGDYGYGIAVDSAGSAYVTGATRSPNFPTTPSAFQTTCNGGNCADAFVLKINTSGSALVYSTYLGGSGGDNAHSITVDSAGNAYLAGSTDSHDFPTKNPLQPANGGGSDAFVAKLNPAGSALIYSTYLGGSDNDDGFGIAVDSGGNAYMTGSTSSTDFPTLNALQSAYGGEGDAYVAKLNPDGSALIYSTYLGGSRSDGAGGIALDSSGNAYVTGQTVSTDFPTMNPLQPAHGGGIFDAFVAKFNPSGSAFVYSTYLGGSDVDGGSAIAVDNSGCAYITGQTWSRDFPTENPVRKRKGGASDAFVAKLNPGGSALLSSTYLGGGGKDDYYGPGGIAVDSANSAYVTGETGSTNFPTMNPLQAVYGGAGDAFVAKLQMTTATTTTLSSTPNPSAYGQTVTFSAVVASDVGAPPNGESVSFVTGRALLGTGTLSGGIASLATSGLSVGNHAVKAVYGGDINFGSSTSKVVTEVVSKATTTITLTSSLNPSNVGQSVTFTASATPQFSGTVKGTVTFYDGTTLLKTVTMSGGPAKFTTSTLTHGTHTITATYNGSTSFSGSSASLTQTVN